MLKRNMQCRWTVYLFFWIVLSSHSPAQVQNPGPEPALPEGRTVVANLCPKFAVAGTSRRLKFYGTGLATLELKAEEEDLSFLDYTFDPDGMAFTVTVEVKPTARTGRRTLTVLLGASEPRNPVQEVTLYVLKKEDKALLQKDLVRCPWMREEEAGKNPKPPAAPPAKAAP